jgi:hypothetical protein
MSRNENRRKKKLDARRRKSLEKKRELAIRKSSGVTGVVAAQKWPVIFARVTDDKRGSGMRTATLARKGPNGQVVAGTFLIDTDCLGVKDAMVFMGTTTEWHSHREQLGQAAPLIDVTPEYICKLVRESVAYAKSIGLQPHRDYSKAMPILGDLDPSECLTQFEFGRDGKPVYINGPHDSSARRKRIVETLERTVGEGNFEVVLMM